MNVLLFLVGWLVLSGVTGVICGRSLFRDDSRGVNASVEEEAEYWDHWAPRHISMTPDVH